MTQTISEIARKNDSFIRDTMTKIGLELDSSNASDEELVRRAAFLSRHNYVKVTMYREEKSIVEMAVQDATITHVTMFMNEERLTCDCPAATMCRHKLAALFSMYQFIDSLSSWLEDFRSKKSLQMSLLKEERTPEGWLRLVQQIYRKNLYNQNALNPYLLESIFSDMQQQIFKHTPLEREWSSIYQLFTHISLLSHTWKHLSAKNEAAMSYFTNFIDNETDKIKALLLQSKTKSRLFALDPFYETLQQVVSYFLLQQEGHFDQRLYIYMQFWESLFTERRSREEELQSLLQQRHVAGDVNMSSITALFYVMLDQKDDLAGHLETMEAKDLLIWNDLAKFAKRNERFDMLQMIVHAMLPKLHSFLHNWLATRYRSTFVAQFTQLCDAVGLNEKESELLFASSGMYGMQPYSHFLIQKGRFSEWAAIHQRFPSSIAYLELCGLKDVLEKQPDVLLPLYHTLAMHELNQKSRQHYKQAVRILKKMKAAAKKSAKNEFWNDYVDALRQKYKRLRALQEEIEKGNLML